MFFLCSFREISENTPVEWSIMSSIMGNASISKVAHDIQNKIVILRDRGIRVAGALRDPSIVATLIKSYYKDMSSEIFELLLPSITNSDRFALSRQEFSEKNIIFRAIGIMRAMERIEITYFNSLMLKNQIPANVNDLEVKSKCFSLFSLLEMPIIHCLSHAEHFGFHLDRNLLLYYRQVIEDRMKGIDFIVKGT